ncbi:Ribose-phosphate pyrophosphokinase [Bordetella sputigena]|uniref:ribose-phosphate pyrophosphokinase n=1 Tax=Bordetella sputigena TaxID=1416810 RepID=UPI0039EED9F2
MQRLILPLPGNEALATRLAAQCGGELGAVETRRFPDGESYVRLHGDPRGRVVDIVCTLARPDPGFLSLVFAADAARDLGAAEVNLVAPYLAYMRQDKRFQPGESISSLSFARVISSTFDRLVTVDPHLHRHPALAALYAIPTATLHAAPYLADWIAANVADPLIIGPDEESEQWAGSIAARIGAPHVVLRKTRHGDRQVDIEAPDLARWRDRTPVLVDDIASSGRTLVAAGAKLAGMRPPQCVIVHAVFAEDAWEQVSSCFERVVSTDTVPHASNRIELTPLLADAILRDLRD